MKFETKNEIIQRRLSIISPLFNLKGSERNAMLARIADDQQISPRTIRRYLKAYTEQGLAGLCPNYQDTKPFSKRYARFDELMDYCRILRRADHKLSVLKIIEACESKYPNCKGILKRATVQRWLQKEGLDRRGLRIADDLKDKKVYLRYRLAHRLEQVQCDFKELPRGVFIDENGAPCKIYIQICIDNYSRMVLSYSVTTNQKTGVFVECLKSMIKSYGIPKTLLMDNGSAYRNAIITRACECLGIKAKFCKPYSPAQKGAIERLNMTLNDVENQLKNLRDVTVKGATEIIRARINEYNASAHSALDGQAPHDVFNADNTPFNLVDEQLLNFAFKKLEKRNVSKDGSISYDGKRYVVDTDYAPVGTDVTLLTDGTTLEQVISDTKTKPVFLQEIKDHVSSQTWQSLTRGIASDEVSNSHSLDEYGYVIKLLREQYKKDGKYFTEEQFMADVRTLLFHQELPPASDGYKTSNQKSQSNRGAVNISPLTELNTFKTAKN